MYKIVIDTKGGDRGAVAMIEGAVAALEKNSELTVVLAGAEALITEECARLGAPADRVEVIDAPAEITNYDSPSAVLFEKPDSSMVRALERAAADDVCGIITAGNTGALMAGAVKHLAGDRRVRPALAAILPAVSGGFVCLVDTGATVDCTPAMLCHFAHLGTDFMRRMYAIDSPRVGLLSTGAESSKGNKAVKETHALLAEDGEINFVGNIEGNTALTGDCDVLVCDGFAGNQVLKVTEGTAMRIITDAVKYAERTGSREIMELVGNLMGVYDINALGGGIVLGTAKPVIKIRGNSDGRSVVSTSEMILNMAQNKAVFDSARNKI